MDPCCFCVNHHASPHPCVALPRPYPRRVVAYYCNRVALSLRCFRLALVIRHKLLQTLPVSATEMTSDPAGASGEGEERFSHAVREDGCEVAAEVEEAAAAVVLNNVGACLGNIGEIARAAQALEIASNITM